MQHLDEGTIHALLDGELAGAEGTQILAHIETCEECSSRVAEERLIQAEAERMILELDEPASRAGPAAVPPFTTDEPFVLPPPSPDQLVRQGPPIVLVPDRDTDRPLLPLRYLAAAAMLVVAAGAGYLAIGARRTPAVAPPHVFTDAPVTITLPPEDGFERRTDGRTESAATAGSGDSIARDLVVADSAGPGDTQRQTLGRSSALRDSAETVALTDRPAAPAGSAAKASERSREPVVSSRPANAERDESAVAQRREQRADRPMDPDSRAREQAAVAEAEGATLPAAAAPRPVTPPPAPRRAALDQEAQITMRVGLDEAQRLLGGPVHVIDGMRPEFMGLVEGRLVPGADPNSYVVRVVYLDDNRRLLFLDQQRLDQSRRLAGAARDTTPPDWVKGEVRLSLKGSMGAAELRTLAGRVR